MINMKTGPLMKKEEIERAERGEINGKKYKFYRERKN